jgi:hypothetical protein
MLNRKDAKAQSKSGFIRRLRRLTQIMNFLRRGLSAAEGGNTRILICVNLHNLRIILNSAPSRLCGSPSLNQPTPESKAA